MSAKLSKKKRRILFIGTARWPQNLARLMNKYAGDCLSARAVSISIKNAPFFLVNVLNADVVVRVGFRPGIRNYKAQFFDATCQIVRALNPKVRWYYYWIGTDVVMAQRDFREERYNRYFRMATYDRHLAGAPWFVEELKAIGIEAVPKLFPLELPQINHSYEVCHRFSVLSYIPDKRAEYYGGQTLFEAAQRLPHIHFDIVGGIGSWIPSNLDNLQFHGWVNDIEKFLVQRPVVVRLVPHDALGGTVREGLAAGCHVIYTQPIEHTLEVPFADVDALVARLQKLYSLYISGQLNINKSGQAFAQEQWNASVLSQDLAKILLI